MPAGVRPTLTSEVIARAEVQSDQKCEGIVRSANSAVKAAQAPLKKVILAISYGGYKPLRDFVEFAKNKNYDDSENTRYLLRIDSRRLSIIPADCVGIHGHHDLHGFAENASTGFVYRQGRLGQLRTGVVRPRASYWGSTRRPLPSLVFVIPLMLAYEIGVIWHAGASPGGAPNRRRCLDAIGAGNAWIDRPVASSLAPDGGSPELAGDEPA